MKKLLIFLLLTFATHLSCSSSYAQGEFDASYNVRYEAISPEVVRVSQEITLQNKLSNIYAKEYSFTLVGSRIENIQANDSLGAVKTEIGQVGDSTTITLFFNEQVVGTGKTLTFSLLYDALDLAKKIGQVWEINIPRLSSESSPQNYSLTLAVPQRFGNLAFIRPQPVDRSSKEGLFLYRFTKEQVLSTGVNAVFGDFQVFNFNLAYHLENPNPTLGETEIALPPDTSFQKIIYQVIEPPPTEIRVDEDGNWLAKYRLKPKERLNIIASGQVKIFSQPTKDYLISTPEILKTDLLPQKYWEVDNSQIFLEAQRLKTPKAIYNFVVQRLNYDFERVKQGIERQGALQAFNNPNNALCMEFTDLFIALARAAGIPAREVNGFAYTNNDKLKPLGLVADLLHSWPEYWDDGKKLWVPIDPTWEKTTGGVDFFNKTDMNHFVFVIHGQNSETPYPAGSYKLDGYGKDIEVTFGEYKGEKATNISVDFKLPKKILGETSTKGSFVIKNIGQMAIYKTPVRIILTDLALFSPKSSELMIDVLPPWGEKQIEIELKPASFIQVNEGAIKIEVNNQQFVYRMGVVSLIWQYLIPLVGLFVVVLIIIFLTRKRFYAKKEPTVS